MKPLQPILDMLERADDPKARTMEAMKPKPAKPANGPVLTMDQLDMLRWQLGPRMEEEMRRQMMQERMYAQQANVFQQQSGLSGLLGRGF